MVQVLRSLLAEELEPVQLNAFAVEVLLILVHILKFGRSTQVKAAIDEVYKTQSTQEHSSTKIFLTFFYLFAVICRIPMAVLALTSKCLVMQTSCHAMAYGLQIQNLSSCRTSILNCAETPLRICLDKNRRKNRRRRKKKQKRYDNSH